MLWTQLARLTLLIDVAVTLTSTDNEVYSGCGFEAVQGQAHMFKFCNAYGQCIKTSCGVDRVFSKSDCGCIPSVKNSITDWTAGTSFILNNVFPNKNSDLRPTSLTDSFSSIMKATDRLVNVVVVDKHQLPALGTTKTGIELPLPRNFTEPSPPVPKNVSNLNSVLFQMSPLEIPGYSASENPNLPISVLSQLTKSTEQDASHTHSVEPKINITNFIKDQETVSGSGPQQNVTSAEEIKPNSSIINGPLINYSFNLSGSLRNDLSAETSSVIQATTSNYEKVGTSTAFPGRAEVTIAYNTTIIATTEATNGTSSISDTGQIMCGAEVNITGMSDRNILTGDAALGTVYVGNRGVTGSGGQIQFEGSGFLWVPLYEGMRFTSGLTVSLDIKEDAAFQLSQGVVSNCGNDVAPSFSIVLDPKSRQIKFKAVVVTTETPVPLQETLQVSIPYVPGTTKTVEMQCDGHKLIGRVSNHVIGTHIPSTETYRLSSRPKPVYIGKGCIDEQADNFHGNITNVVIHRCVRSNIPLS